MTWIEEMEKAMRLMQAACAKNEEWAGCWKCPFERYCTIIEDRGYYTPEEWFGEKEE